MAIHPDLLATTVLDGHRRHPPVTRRLDRPTEHRHPVRRWAAGALRRGADALDHPQRSR